MLMTGLEEPLVDAIEDEWLESLAPAPVLAALGCIEFDAPDEVE
jgi:hypothetical protein